MPYEQRGKLIDKYQSKYQKSKSNSSNEITIGSLVRETLFKYSCCLFPRVFKLS
jgi:hypothetical protein